MYKKIESIKPRLYTDGRRIGYAVGFAVGCLLSTLIFSLVVANV